MVYINADSFREALLLALSQQSSCGAMPDGILIHPDAQLKYINQVPHTDHNIWIPICLNAYLNETGNLAVLDELVSYADSDQEDSVFDHIQAAMSWLIAQLDADNLSLINQGDWCDPMNMVGYQGKGVSSWLSMATVWALKSWASLCDAIENPSQAELWRQHADKIEKAVNKIFWQGEWYARGRSDNGRIFGTQDDVEGKIYSNPQSWAIVPRQRLSDQLA